MKHSVSLNSLGFCSPEVRLGRVLVPAAFPKACQSLPEDESQPIFLPQWNGICLFDTNIRDIASLYTDTSGHASLRTLRTKFEICPTPFQLRSPDQQIPRSTLIFTGWRSSSLHCEHGDQSGPRPKSLFSQIANLPSLA